MRNDNKIVLEFLIENYNQGIYLRPWYGPSGTSGSFYGGASVSESYCLSEINKLRKQVEG